ncbi:MAG: MFS transporter, partial [Bacteroidales bacterium]
LAHQFINKSITIQGMENLAVLKAEQNYSGDMLSFCSSYIEKLSDSYSYSFGVACISLIFSMAIYYFFRGTYKNSENYSIHRSEVDDSGKDIFTPAQTKKRITALLLVFAVVIFFWMSFNQNGLTMTFFARDYIAHSVTGFNRLLFSVISLSGIIVAVYSLISLFQSKHVKGKMISAIIAAVAIAIVFYGYYATEDIVDITPQIFQQFNPFFVVVLTPLLLWVFSILAKRGKEPSAPRKIGYGMIVAAFAFLILAIGSIGLITPDEIKLTGVSNRLVSPDWMISTYLVLTFAELLLSPMGISFVSKVAPQKYKGAMMGCWFAATAVGNYLVSVVGYLWGGLPVWAVWSVLITCCLISAAIIFSLMRRIEVATK